MTDPERKDLIATLGMAIGALSTISDGEKNSVAQIICRLDDWLKRVQSMKGPTKPKSHP